MNTRKLIFGLLAVIMLVAASASTYIVDSQETGVRKSKITEKR